jgi:hypothetical protein
MPRRFKKKVDGTVVELFPPTDDSYQWKERYAPNSTFKVKQTENKPKRKAQKSSLKVLDELLWNLVSQYIRRRDADEYGMCRCITCNCKPKHWKKMQAGHWQSRGKKPTKFLEQNIHAQCVQCNLYKSGMQDQHGLAINKKYGPGTAERIRQLSDTLVQFTVADYHTMIRDYKNKLAALPELPDHPTT